MRSNTCMAQEGYNESLEASGNDLMATIALEDSFLRIIGDLVLLI